jgi:hypothetical protein
MSRTKKKELLSSANSRPRKRRRLIKSTADKASVLKCLVNSIKRLNLSPASLKRARMLRIRSGDSSRKASSSTASIKKMSTLLSTLCQS